VEFHRTFRHFKKRFVLSCRNFLQHAVSIFLCAVLSGCIAEINEPASIAESLMVFSSTGTSNPSSFIVSYDFGGVAAQNPYNGFATEEIFIVNTGSLLATDITPSINSSTFTFEGGSYPGTGGTCDIQLDIGQSCKIVLRVEPPSEGFFTGVLSLNYSDEVGTKVINLDLIATGATPAVLTYNEPVNPYDFGQIPIATSAEHVIVVENTGGATAKNVLQVGFTGVPDFQFSGGLYPGVGGSCSDSLGPGDTCTLVVNFTPTVVGGRSDFIDLSYFDGTPISANAVFGLTGIGVIPAKLVFDRAPEYDFGQLVLSQTGTVILNVTNTGGIPASSMTPGGISFPFTFVGGSYPGTGGTCGSALAGGATCTVSIEYAPINPGLHTDGVEITYNNGAVLDTASRDLRGEVLSPAQLTLSEDPLYNYGVLPLGSRASQSFTLTNSGQAAANAIVDGFGLSAPFQFLGGVYPGAGGDCNTSLAGGASCTIFVEFAPVVAANFSDAIELSYFNGLVVQNIERNLQGVGVVPASISISETNPYSYGSVPVGGSVSHMFTLTNGGGFAATSVNEIGLTAPFTFVGGTFPGTGGNCSPILAVAASCNLDPIGCSLYRRSGDCSCKLNY